MFDDQKLYQTDDPALEVLGRPATLAIWRSGGRGPEYIKLGNRVLYRGKALNEYLAARIVRPAGAREAVA